MAKRRSSAKKADRKKGLKVLGGIYKMGAKLGGAIERTFDKVLGAGERTGGKTVDRLETKAADQAEKSVSKLGTKRKRTSAPSSVAPAPSTPSQEVDLLDLNSPEEPIGQMAKGGFIRKTGNYKLHKGEVVVPKNATDILRRVLRRNR